MSAGRATPANGDVITISGPLDSGRRAKAVVHVKLNGGALTLAPRTLMQGSTDLTVADATTILYSSPNSTSTSTADITTSGEYDFPVSGRLLFLTASGVTGTPIVEWTVVESDAGGVSAGGGGGGGGAITAASGAYAAGSLAVGSQVDGASVTQGSKADPAWDRVAGSATEIAILKDQDLTLELIRAAVADVTTPAPITDAGYVVSGVEYTRPADTTAYTAGDAVGNSTSALTPMDFGAIARVASGYVLLRKVRIQTDQATNTMQFRLHLYTASPTSPANDNAAFSLNYTTDKTVYVGYVDVPALTANGTSAAADNDYVAKVIKCAAGMHLFGLLEVRNAPAAPANGQKIYTEITAVQIS